MRIHRSHIINLNRIKKIEKGQIAQLTMDDNTELPISSEKRHALMEYVERFKL
jgi:DNA-binding LytR/AlgR family response regulator